MPQQSSYLPNTLELHALDTSPHPSLLHSEYDPSFRPQTVQHAPLTTKLSSLGTQLSFRALGITFRVSKNWYLKKGKPVLCVLREKDPGKQKASPGGRDGSAGKVLVVHS